MNISKFIYYYNIINYLNLIYFNVFDETEVPIYWPIVANEIFLIVDKILIYLKFCVVILVYSIFKRV